MYYTYRLSRGRRHATPTAQHRHTASKRTTHHLFHSSTLWDLARYQRSPSYWVFLVKSCQIRKRSLIRVMQTATWDYILHSKNQNDCRVSSWHLICFIKPYMLRESVHDRKIMVIILLSESVQCTTARSYQFALSCCVDGDRAKLVSFASVQPCIDTLS